MSFMQSQRCEIEDKSPLENLLNGYEESHAEILKHYSKTDINLYRYTNVKIPQFTIRCPPFNGTVYCIKMCILGTVQYINVKMILY